MSIKGCIKIHAKSLQEAGIDIESLKSPEDVVAALNMVQTARQEIDAVVAEQQPEVVEAPPVEVVPEPEIDVSRFEGKTLDQFIQEAFNKTRLDRAKKQGFDTSTTYYHGTGSDISEFKGTRQDKFTGLVPDGEERAGIYFTQNPNDAAGYAMGAATETKEGAANIIPVYLKMENPYRAKVGEFGFYATKDDVTRLKSQGHDGIIVEADYGPYQTIVFDANQIRSVNATFDPSQADSGNLIDKTAEAFENFLFEGKAQDPATEAAFRTNRAEMLDLYNQLGPANLTPDVRGAFDRMLASEQLVTDRQIDSAYEPLYASKAESGMTERQWEEYTNMAEKQRTDSQSALEARSLQDMRWLHNQKIKALRAHKKDAQEKRAPIRDEVEDEVNKEPVYLATNYFKNGEVKLNRAEWKELYPGVPAPRNLTIADGLPLQEASNLFGFSSGEAMAQEITQAEPIKQRIERLTDIRVLEQYGDLNSPEAQDRAIEEAIHNAAHIKFLHTELNHLTKGQANKNVLNRAAKQIAATQIAGRRVRDLTPQRHVLAERRAAKSAERALKKGDREQAIHHKRAQILQNHLWTAANNAQKEAEKTFRYVKRLLKPSAAKRIGAEGMDQINALLEQFEFKKISNKELDQRATMQEWMTQQENQGFEPIVDPELLSAASKKSYRDMTIEELNELKDSLKNIEHLSVQSNKFYQEFEQQQFNVAIENAENSIRKNAGKRVKERPTPTDVAGKIGAGVRAFGAMHRKFSSIVRQMDGGKDMGQLWTLLNSGLSKSGDTKADMARTDAHAVADIFEPIMGNIHKGGIPFNIYTKENLIPGTNISMSKERQLMFAINWGNPQGRQRLMDGGMSGKDAITRAEAQAILDDLSVEEMNFVQGIIDHAGSKKELIAEQERRLTGVTPQWIDPVPIETSKGTWPGGYFPIKYDAALSERSSALEALTDIRSTMKGIFSRASTRHSYTMKRAEEVKGRPVLLSFNAISQHLDEVNHRLAYQDWVSDSGRILKSLESPIREFYGPELLKELKDTVADVAAGDALAKHWWETLINHVRVGATVVGMGWRVTTALIQPSGLAQSWARLGGKWVHKGVIHYMKNPLEASRLANEESVAMRNREIAMQREIHEVLGSVRAGETNARIKASLFYLIQKFQRTVDVPTYWGAKEKALASMGYENAQSEAERKKIEKRAITFAETTVKDSQASGMTGDLAKIQRGGPLMKLWTNFYSYFSATYNLNVEAVKQTHFNKPDEVAALAADLVIINFIPALFATAMRELMKNECEGDPECLGMKLASEQLNFVLGQTLPTREITSAVSAAVGLESFDYAGPAGIRLLTDLTRLGKQANQGEADMAFWKALAKSGGAILHLPTGQAMATIEGIVAVENGDVEGVRGTLGAILTGPPYKQ